MTDQDAERSGILVLNAWLEVHGPPLRVRITGRLGVDPDDETSVTVAGAEAAAEIVHDWLTQLEGPAP